MPSIGRTVVGAWGRIAILVVGAVATDRVVTAQGPPSPPTLEQCVARIDAAREHAIRTGAKTANAAAMTSVIEELAAAARRHEERGEVRQAAECRFQAAVARQFEGKDDIALAELPAIVKQAADSGAKEIEARALELEARLLFYRKNDLARARERIERAIRVGRTLDSPRWLADALALEAELDQAQGDLAGAYTGITEALNLGVTDDRFVAFAQASRCGICGDIAKLADHQGATTFHVDMAKEALDAADKLLAIADRHGWGALQKAGQQYRKSASFRVALLEQQVQFAKTAREFATAATEPQRPEDVVVSETFGMGEAAEGLPPELPALMEEAGYRQSASAGLVYAQAHMDQLMGRTDAALEGYRRAVDLLEREYGSLADEGARRSKLAPHIDFYYTPMLVLLEQKRYDEAFEYFEAARSRVLSDLLATKERIRLAEPAQQRLYEELCDVRARLRELLASGNAKEDDVRPLEAERERLLEEIRRTNPGLLALTTAAPVALKDVVKAATDGGYDVLAYLSMPSQLVVWHIGPTGVHVRSVFLPNERLTAKVAAFAETLKDPRVAFDEKTARQLHLLLVEPMRQFLSTKHLVIVPHQALYTLPFPALRDHPDGRFLGESYAISTVPTTRVLLGRPNAAPLSSATVLALVGPDVPDAAAEASEIVGLYPDGSRAVPLSDSTPAYLARTCDGFDVVHVAAHGRFDALSPMRSSVLLAGADGGTEPLTAAEMFGLPLERTRLVTLSACESGQVSGLETGEVLGIPRALLHAGADAIYLSRWKVDSATTRALMRAFYGEARAAPLDVAAQRAAAKVRADPRTAHPYYWAAFDLIGR